MKKGIFFRISVFCIIFCLFFSCISGVSSSALTFNIDFDTTSKAIYLVNLDTGIVAYEQNAQEKRSPASTTKIMTYIVATEMFGDVETSVVTVDEEVLELLAGTGSSLAGLEANEKLTVLQLLHCLMIPSGNDAAMILAYHLGEGNIDKFVEMMNEKAEELGCENTHFSNPHGLYAIDHYTTVEDMYKIAKYALQAPHFTEICGMTTSYILGEDRPLITTNSLLDPARGGDYYYQYCRGIKTGWCGDESGYCLVSYAIKNGYTYLCVAFGAPSSDKDGNEIEENGAMIDSKNLYEWAFNTLELKSVIDEQKPICEVNINNAWNKDTILLVPENGYTTLLPSNVESSSIDIKTSVPDSVDTPIRAGDVIGTATISYANQELTTVNLIATESVERSSVLYYLQVGKNVLGSKWFVLSITIVAVLFFIYVIMVIVYNSKKQKQRTVKKYRNL